MFEDYTFNPTTKKISRVTQDDIANGSKPIFVAMVLEPLWQIYEVAMIDHNPHKAAKMAKRGVWICLL
jgi:hypothetical protein